MRQLGTWRALTIGISTTLLAALSAGCGAPGTNPVNVVLSPASTLASTVTKLQSSSASTAKFTATVSMGSTGRMSMTGVQRFTPSTALHAQVDLSGGQLGTILGSSIEIVLLDGVEYVKFGSDSLYRRAGAKPWMKIDLSQMSTGSGANVGSALKLDQNTDPRQQVELLLTSGDVKRLGTQTVDGVKTTHYAGNVDPSRMLARSGSKLTPDEVRNLQSTLRSAGITNEHIDVWIDNSGLLVEMKAAVDSTAAGTITVDEHLSAWGAPVSIAAPPADQVADMSRLISGG